jgi:hypothetical protein
MSRPRGGWTKGRPALLKTSSILMLDVVRRCNLGSGGVGAGGASALAPACSKVAYESGDTAGGSENLCEALLDQVLKCAGGGREPVGRAGRLMRRLCR